MEKLVEWAKRYQVVAFFVLTFVISWGLWLPFVPIVFGRGIVVFAPLFVAGVFGPALAGITISRIVHPSPLLGKRKIRFFAFLLTWLVATVVFALYWAESAEDIDLSAELIVIATVTALVPALIVSSAFSRVPGVRNYLETLVKPGGNICWYVAAILIPPGILSLSIIISHLFGIEIPSPSNPVDYGRDFIVAVVLSSGYGFFFGNAVGEEVGWRGFALPRLQAKCNPLVASLILAFPWFIWHFPLPQSQGFLSNLDLTTFLDAYWSFLLNSLIIAWLFNRTGGSILAAGLFHVSFNVSVEYLPVPDAWDFIRPAFCLLIIVLDQMWRKLPPDSAAVYQADYQAAERGA
jgi:membrane protease YdiL (CAAX protease family)